MSKPQRKKPNSRPTRKVNVIAADRRARALDMRREGMSLRAIAVKLGMNVSSVWETIQVGLAETVKPVSEELRELELQRLDHLLAKNKNAVNAGDTHAIRAQVRIIEARAKLLGLNAPEKHEHAGPGGMPLTLVVDTGLVPVQNLPPPHPANTEAQ